ncbi:MAG TPA: YceI family protein [Actinocrinis sp.]|jgi:polyisoprenoid-binding protein YceI
MTTPDDSTAPPAGEATTSSPAAVSAAAFATGGAAAGDWTLDPTGSLVEFHTTSMWGMAKVHGRFGTVSGAGAVAADGTVTGRIEIDAASVDSKIKKRDDHLRSADFFHVEQHPAITVVIEGIAPQEGDRVEVRGTLTARGHGEALAFPATVTEAGADAVTIHAEFEVDRSRFGMTWSPMKMAPMRTRIAVTARFLRTAA